MSYKTTSISHWDVLNGFNWANEESWVKWVYSLKTLYGSCDFAKKRRKFTIFILSDQTINLSSLQFQGLKKKLCHFKFIFIIEMLLQFINIFLLLKIWIV